MRILNEIADGEPHGELAQVRGDHGLRCSDALGLTPAEQHVGPRLAEHLYLVDPQGHWMMRFPARLDREGAASVKRDLERLMRASAGWDEAGRK